MAIALPGLDQLPPGPQRDFVEALHALYDAAGRPGARVISAGIRQDRTLPETVSHETVSAALRGATVPASFAKVRSIVIVLNRQCHRPGDEDKMLDNFWQLWLATRSLSGDAIRDDAAESPASAVPPAEALPSAADDREIRSADAEDEAEQPPPAIPRQPIPPSVIIGGLPEHNGYFTGREALLDAMRDQLRAHPNAPLVLYGIGGIGKTQLAREYVDRFSAEYSLIWWIPADRAERARGALVDLAERLDLPSRHSAEQTVAAVINALESQVHRYVLIFDGVEDDEIRDLVPSLGGHVVITTRNPSWAHDSANVAIEVSDFDRAEAFQFLRRRGSDLAATEAEELLNTVGRLPLVLEQLVAVRLARKWSWAELVLKIAEPDHAVLSDGQPEHYAHNLEVSLRLAMSQLAHENPIAGLAFEMFAWFGSEPVSFALMKSGVRGKVSPSLQRILRDPVQFPKMLADISRYGLARLNTNTQRVEVQPFVRLTLRDILSPAARERAQQNVHEILKTADPGWPDDLTFLGLHREIAPHVLPSGLIGSRKEEAQRTVVNQIRYRYRAGDHENAARLAEEAVTTWKGSDFLGPGHTFVLQATREWANALRALGRYREARELTKEAMDRLGQPAESGEHHELWLALRLGYAADLRIDGRYREALDVDNENHRHHVLLYTEEHSRTVTSRHNVAVSLRHVGEFNLAAASDRKELEHYRLTLGPEHSMTLLAVHAVAEDLYGLGQYGEAVDLLANHLDASRRVLGLKHSGVLGAERIMGLACRGMGRLADAVDILRDHFYGCMDSFGVDHEYTLVARMSYANALRERGGRQGLAEAHLLAEEAVSTYQRIFDPRNPLTLAAEVNLAAVLRAEGERARARQIGTVACEALRDALGERHPYTIAATINRATDLALSGDQIGALDLSEYAYRKSAEGRGPTHPDTLAAGANLVLDRSAFGAARDAEELLEEVLGRLRRTLGPGHPMVTTVASGIRIECAIEPPAT